MTPKRKPLPRLTDRLSLGDAGLRVSPVCLGLAGDEDTASRAFDAGINFFLLSADMHWPVYEQARRGLQKLLRRGGDVRRQLVVAAVSYLTQPEFCTSPFLELLQAVPELQALDLALAGGVYGADFLGRLPVYQDHRRQRLAGIQAIGATFHDRRAALLAVNHDLVDVAFVRYNAAFPGGRSDLFPGLKPERAAAVFGFNSTAGHVPDERVRELGQDEDNWQPHITDHYRFALTASGLQGLLCALRTDQIDPLAQALAADGLLPEEEAYLIDLSLLDRQARAGIRQA